MDNLGSISSKDKKLFIFNDNECGICLEKYRLTDELNATPCLHIFHNKCIKRWLNEQIYCPKCKGNCTIENLDQVSKSIYERLIHPNIKYEIQNAIELNNFNELVAIIEEFSFCATSSVYLKQSFLQIIEQQDNLKLDRILEKLLGEDSLSVDKHENICDLLQQILAEIVQKATNMTTIISLLDYDIFLTTDDLSTVFHRCFQDRKFNALSKILNNNYGVVFSIKINVIKGVIQEDINKNNKTEIKQALEVISILKQREEYSNDISDIIIDLLEFIEKTDNNESIIEAIIQ
jgi:hypothetical protein